MLLQVIRSGVWESIQTEAAAVGKGTGTTRVRSSKMAILCFSIYRHKCRKEPRQAEEIYMHRYTDWLPMGGHLTTQTIELEFIKRRMKYSLVSAVAETKYILVCYEWHSHFALSLLRAAQSLYHFYEGDSRGMIIPWSGSWLKICSYLLLMLVVCSPVATPSGYIQPPPFVG